ncbi:MAG: hypothetical protein AAFX85_12750 [Pseudomonadota bacterium]
MSKVVVFVLLSLLSLGAAAKDVVNVLFVGSEGDAYRGFLQALDEANLQGRFLGYEFAAERGNLDTLLQGGGEQVSAIFTAVPDAPFRALAARFPQVPMINLTSRTEALRRACTRHTFFAAATDAMLDDAMAQWKAAGNDAEGVAVKVWNTSFRRYAAIQVSIRFAEGQGQLMSDEAYAGWAATRLFGQVVVETGTTEPAALIKALHGDVQFDGSKGVPMNYRTSGQLNQMLLLEKDGRVVGTAPVRGVREAFELETLGYAGCKETE